METFIRPLSQWQRVILHLRFSQPRAYGPRLWRYAGDGQDRADAETVVVTARVLKSCQAKNKSPLPYRSADRSLQRRSKYKSLLHGVARHPRRVILKHYRERARAIKAPARAVETM